MRLLIDASVFITLSEIDALELLDSLEGDVVVPKLVADELQDEPSHTALEEARGDWISVEEADEEGIYKAMRRLNREGKPRGDVALLALAFRYDEPIVVTDDKPLRNTCKTLGISLSGSIGVVVASVEKESLDPDEAKDLLVAMDEVGARLSARLLQKAERLIDEAVDDRF